MRDLIHIREVLKEIMLIVFKIEPAITYHSHSKAFDDTIGQHRMLFRNRPCMKTMMPVSSLLGCQSWLHGRSTLAFHIIGFARIGFARKLRIWKFTLKVLIPRFNEAISLRKAYRLKVFESLASAWWVGDHCSQKGESLYQHVCDDWNRIDGHVWTEYWHASVDRTVYCPYNCSICDSRLQYSLTARLAPDY